MSRELSYGDYVAVGGGIGRYVQEVESLARKEHLKVAVGEEIARYVQFPFESVGEHHHRRSGWRNWQVCPGSGSRSLEVAVGGDGRYIQSNNSSMVHLR